MSGPHFLISAILVVVLSACSLRTPFLQATPTSAPPTQTATPKPSATPSPTVTATLTLIPTETPFPQPAGCLPPTDDYTRLTVNGMTLNQRTMSMLQQAADLYTGEIDLAGSSITQGSYTNDVDASFGTHAGGGAVDISVMAPGTWTILWDDLPTAIDALRQAGFAAWVRELDELYPGSPIHIHAVAIGDRELSAAASEQISGQYGYFNGYDGLPEGYGGPKLDRYGGPIICEWMVIEGLAAIATATP